MVGYSMIGVEGRLTSKQRRRNQARDGRSGVGQYVGHVRHQAADGHARELELPRVRGLALGGEGARHAAARVSPHGVAGVLERAGERVGRERRADRVQHRVAFLRTSQERC